MKLRRIIFLALAALVILAGLGFAIPPVRESVFYRFDQLRIRVFYALNPPEEAVFTPDEQVAVVVRSTLTQAAAQAALATATLPPTATVTATALPPDVPTATATFTPAPPPKSALVENVPYVDQHYGFNNCAPANLTMALQFWNWGGTRESVSESVKPFAKDKNVMPYELVDFVNSLTDLRALMRVGGTPETLKRLISAGYPVIVERGVYLRDLSGKISWMGHYQVVYGYDDKAGQWQVKDSFEKGGDHFKVGYNELIRGWRSFNYAFLVIYPPENEGELLGLLGSYADEANANQLAAQIASDEIASTQGQDQFFASSTAAPACSACKISTGRPRRLIKHLHSTPNYPATSAPGVCCGIRPAHTLPITTSGVIRMSLTWRIRPSTRPASPTWKKAFTGARWRRCQLGDQSGAVEDLKQEPGISPWLQPLRGIYYSRWVVNDPHPSLRRRAHRYRHPWAA